MKTPLSRRKFLAASAAATTFQIVPRHVLGGPGQTPPGEKLNIAGIGVGSMGASNLRKCVDENIVALCDVDHKFAAPVFKEFPKAKVYTDFREMLDRQKDIDAVIIATPDHTHAVITMRAMEAGKHVYCQKPLTHSVHEARVITEAARRYGVQTQMGNQGHSSEYIRLMKEWIDDGAIGDVREVHAWTDRPVGGKPWSTFAVKAKSAEKPRVPKHLNWDLWLGPAQYRDYHPDYHPQKWRAWIDFGTGPLGDMGCHILDPAFWALDLGAPDTINASTTHWEDDVSSQTFPRASIVRYRFPARGKKPPVKLTWYDGRLLPPRPEELEPDRALPKSGAIIIGDKGKMMHGSHGASSLRIIPESRMQAYQRPPKTIPRIKGSHESDWIRACKEGSGGTPASSSFEYGGALTEMVLLGMAAIQMKDHNLRWDSKNLRFTNNDEANALINPPYREGWVL